MLQHVVLKPSKPYMGLLYEIGQRKKQGVNNGLISVPIDVIKIGWYYLGINGGLLKTGFIVAFPTCATWPVEVVELHIIPY